MLLEYFGYQLASKIAAPQRCVTVACLRWQSKCFWQQVNTYHTFQTTTNKGRFFITVNNWHGYGCIGSIHFLCVCGIYKIYKFHHKIVVEQSVGLLETRIWFFVPCMHASGVIYWPHLWLAVHNNKAVPSYSAEILKWTILREIPLLLCMLLTC